jgi:hypothetical protein
VNRSAGSKHMGNLATHAPASTHRRVLSLVLVDQVEMICKILSCSVQPNSPNILANRHHMLQVIIRITQVHQDETSLQFTLMVASIVVNWDIMLASTQIITSRLPKKTTVKDSDNHHLEYVMEVQILISIRVNRITCMAEWTTWQLNKLKTLLVLCWIHFLSNSVPATILFDFGASHYWIICGKA